MVITSSVQLGVNPFSNVHFFLVIRTLSPTWNLDDVAFLPMICIVILFLLCLVENLYIFVYYLL